MRPFRPSLNFELLFSHAFQATEVAREMMKENMLHHAKYEVHHFMDGPAYYRLQWDSRVCPDNALPGRYRQQLRNIRLSIR